MLALVNVPDANDEGVDRRTSLADERTTLAGQRTTLAGERTLLAWWRTGLTAIAVALAVGRLLPELAKHQTHWPYVALGVGFALYGIAMFVLGTHRLGAFDRRGSGDDRVLIVLMGAGVVLGLGTLALILAR
jgi:putative membrane protein